MINYKYFFCFPQVFPAIFVLMNKKTKKSYEHVFNYINTNVVKLDGAVFMADFEIGLCYKKNIRTF